jgi:gas vesicle protein
LSTTLNRPLHGRNQQPSVKEVTMGKFGKFLGGATAGLLAGAVAALLLAPESGDGLRKTFQQRLTAIREEARRAAAEQRAMLEAELARLRGDETGR